MCSGAPSYLIDRSCHCDCQFSGVKCTCVCRCFSEAPLQAGVTDTEIGMFVTCGPKWECCVMNTIQVIGYPDSGLLTPMSAFMRLSRTQRVPVGGVGLKSCAHLV